MPCKSDYLDATQSEKNLSIIYGLLDELETGKLPPNFGNGYDERVYNKGLSKAHLDEKVINFTVDFTNNYIIINNKLLFTSSIKLWIYF